MYGSVVVGCRVPFARVPDHVTPLRLATGAMVASAVGLAVLRLWPAPAGLLLGAVVLGCGVAFSMPAIFATVPATGRGAGWLVVLQRLPSPPRSAD